MPESEDKTTPKKPGFYWAQWRISDHDHELPPVGAWEVVDLHINGGDPQSREYMKVSVCGVERSESPENFVWGDDPLIEGPTAGGAHEIMPMTLC